MKHIFAFVLFLFLVNACNFQPPAELLPPELITYETGRELPLVIDYSYAGYKLGLEKPSWKKPELPVFHVDSFGAAPNDGKDDIDAIQAAVDSAGKTCGGLIKFSKGQYDFDVETTQRFVKIPYSNIILLGAGEGPDGTTLFDHKPSETPVPGKLWLAGVYPSFFSFSPIDLLDNFEPGDSLMKEVITLGKADKDQVHFEIENPDAIEAGKIYLLTMSTNDRELLSDLIYPLEKAGNNYEKLEGNNIYKVRQMVKVEGINKGRLKLDSPVVWKIKDSYDLKLWEFPVDLIENSAVIGFHMETDWHEEFYHHKNSIHDNGWDHVKFNLSYNCFAYSIIHENPTTAISLRNSMNCSVFECRIKGNTGHNGFGVSGYSTRNLLYNLKGGKAFHTYSLQGYSSGNVFYNCWSEEPSSLDCHGGLSIYNLFDNIYGATWVHGGSPGNLPPAHAFGLAIWNWKTGMTEPYKGRIKQKIAGFKEVPSFFFTGISGMYGQKLYMQNNSGQLLKDQYSGEWGNNLNFNQDPPIHSLFLFQRSGRIEKEFLIR